MHLEPYRLIKDPPLSEDYIRYFDKLRDRFDYDPHEDTTWCERAEWLDLQADSRADRQSVAARLLEYNERISNDPAALKAASTLAEERTLAVVGGQQAGLFTGPLLVIYKAITIIRTARQLAAQLDRPVVPVFWIAGEDHDWEEVDHIYQLTPEMRVEKLRLDLDITQRRPVSDVEIPNSEWGHILAQMRATSIDTEFSAPLFERLGELASQSRTLVDLFARMLAWLFGPYGLVLLDSADPELRKLESSMMERIVRYSESLANRLVAGSDAVRTLGYQIQRNPN